MILSMKKILKVSIHVTVGKSLHGEKLVHLDNLNAAVAIGGS